MPNLKTLKLSLNSSARNTKSNMGNLEAQLRLLHYNRDYISLAIGDYIVSNSLEIYDVAFDKIVQLMADADAKAATNFFQTEFSYSKEQVNELIDSSELDNEDYIYNPRVLACLDWDALTVKLLESEELQYLLDRGLTIETIKEFKVARICDIPEELSTHAGAKVHPAIVVHKDRTPEGYCFPVFDNGKIIGSICRFTNLLPEIKWCASIPCYYLYNNLHKFETVEDLYICEGVFDGLAFEDYSDVPWISLASGYFSEFQYINLLILLMKHNVKRIHFVLDSDAIGIMSAYLSKHVLSELLEDVEFKCYLLPTGKDPGEHFARDNKKISDLIEADDELLISTYNEVKRHTEPTRFDDYLENRKKQIGNDQYNYKN